MQTLITDVTRDKWMAKLYNETGRPKELGESDIIALKKIISHSESVFYYPNGLENRQAIRDRFYLNAVEPGYIVTGRQAEKGRGWLLKKTLKKNRGLRKNAPVHHAMGLWLADYVGAYRFRLKDFVIVGEHPYTGVEEVAPRYQYEVKTTQGWQSVFDYFAEPWQTGGGVNISYHAFFYDRVLPTYADEI